MRLELTKVKVSRGSVSSMGPVVITVLFKRNGLDKKKKAIICYLKAEEEGEGYRQRMHQYWKDLSMSDVKEQCLAEQVRSILV